ncbi:MAG TPA: hypothetical protein VGP25_20570 [Gemmatimonadaceae bacterium]|nr:hypothetical protein [Gemmatimonadaceae bacterium]
MRSTLRAAGLLALVVAAITCADAPTAPDHSNVRSTVRIGLAPSFSADAARAYRGLVEFGFEIGSARIRLTAADGTVAKDTVIAFPATQDTLQADLSVQMQGSEQTFTALIELRDATGVVLFTGSRLVTARASGVPSAAPPTIPLDYAGPGRNARSLAVTPDDGPRSASDVVSLTASALDASGRTVADLLVRWTSSDAALGALTTTGSAAAELHGAGKRGTVVITATSPTGLTASTRISLVPPASRLVVIGGGAQTGVAGRALAQPFVVELQAADGGPVPGAGVTFRAVSTGGAVATTTTTTDSAGRARSAITLGKSAGTYLFEAASGTLAPASVSAFATAAPAAAIAIASGDAQTDSVDGTLAQPFVVKVVDEFGGAAAGVVVDWRVVAGAGSLGAASATTDTNGLASVTYTLGGTPQVDSVRASVAGIAGSAGSVVFTTRSIPRKPGGTGASTFQVIQALPSTVVVGVPPSNTLKIQLADAAGNPMRVAGITVTATSTSSSGQTTPTSVSAVSDTAGIVTFTMPAYFGALGSVTVTLVAPGFTPLVTPAVTIVAGPIAQMHITTQPSAAATSGATFAVQPTVQLEDAGGNPVAAAGVIVTAYVASGGGVLGGTAAMSTDATGLATFTDLSITASAGQKRLGFASGSLPDVRSNQISLGNALIPAALDSLRGYQAPSTASSTVVLNTFKVRLVDSSAHPVPHANVPVTVRATPFGATSPSVSLSGTVTRPTNASGVATFDDIAFNTAAGAYVLTARADSAVVALPVLTLVDSLTLFTGPAAAISVSSGARTLHTGGTTLAAGVITFQVTDALGATTPSRSYPMSFATFGNCAIQPANRTVNTGYTSSASVPIDMLGGPGSCLVTATTPGVASPAVAQIVTPPANATHVWFGAPGSGTSAWESSSGWMPVPPMTAGSWPSSQTSDDAFVPFWNGVFSAPRLTVTPPPAAGPLAIHRLHVDSLATLDLGGQSLVVAGDSSGGAHSIESSAAQIINGRVLLYGAGALVTGGVFDRLSIGDTLTASSNFCASNSVAARLRNVTVLNALDVHCKLVVDSTVTAGTVHSFTDAAQPGWILLASPAAMLRATTGAFDGDSLVIATGIVDVTGSAAFGGTLEMSSGTTLTMGTDATFQGAGTLAGAQLTVGRHATFRGPTATGYSFSSGARLDVLGNVILGVSSALDVAAGANVQVAGSCTGRTTNGASLTGAGAVNGTAITASTCTP